LPYFESFSPQIISSLSPISLIFKEAIFSDKISDAIFEIHPKVKGAVVLKVKETLFTPYFDLI